MKWVGRELHRAVFFCAGAGALLPGFGALPVFSEQLGIAPQVTGHAQLQWGIKFKKNPSVQPNEYTHGFRTTNDLKISLPLVPKATHLRRGGARSGVWAELRLKDLTVDFESPRPGQAFTLKKPKASFEATLHCYNAYLTIGKDPNCFINFAQLWDPFVTSDYKQEDVRYAPGFGGYGGKLGYRAQDIGGSGIGLDVGLLSFASNGMWDSGTAHSKYGFGADATLTYTHHRAERIKMELAGNATLEPQYTTGTEQGKNNEQKNRLLWSAGGRLTLTPGYGFRLVLALDVGNIHRSDADIGKTVNVQAKAAEAVSAAVTEFWAQVAQIMANGGVGEFFVKKVRGAALIAQVALVVSHLEGKLSNLLQSTPGLGAVVNQLTQGFAELLKKPDPAIALVTFFAWLHRLHVHELGADALLSMQWKWLSSGAYFATAGANMFGKRVFSRQLTDYLDCAAFLKLETKSGDPYTHLLTGLNAGVEARLYIPFTYTSYVNNGGIDYKKTTMRGPINLPVVGKTWLSYQIALGSHAWLKPYAVVYGTTNRFNTDKANNLLREKAMQYHVGFTVSPIEKVEFDARWEQGRLATAPYMLITEDISSDKHFGTFVCGLKIAW
ncbi:major outer sheath N-terminal domain-containing protein [Treponema pallidum]|uniref:major outer sheath N-terminal domain-containing protein n=1 Tax=Treponema pallidum TaxID=160 RepID=UPI000AE55C7E|nr:major outer sheath N-terminal domain-containing protein [Treponema pallidum]QUJ40109.1 hypothetical protein KEA04_05125 [Treponema pallidum]QUL35905.1 hypothetical protein KEA93_05120 [Treponema pallidum]UWU98571.1 hypothetical protein N3P11_05245 [Treponema pallidum]UWV00671.1 hypothetical protein N3P07_05180 [Treponema pallidum]UWV01661.1 hypothetical protein N3P10_05185 [Treponema pallidum]